MIVLNKNIKYHFNPFGGLSMKEIPSVINPEKHLIELRNLLQNSDPLILELTGKKGRGKTTHLKLLHKYFPNSKMFQLEKGRNFFKEIMEAKSNLLFIDSIHHLNIFQRLKVYQMPKQIVFSTHLTRSFENIFSHNKFISFKIKGISSNYLMEMIKNRVKIAATGSIDTNQIILNKELIEKLMSKYGDDYRGILRELYVNFSNEN